MRKRGPNRAAPAGDSFGKAPSAEDRERRRRERALDEALQATFPASDPVAILEPAGRQEPTEPPTPVTSEGGAGRE